MKLECEYYRGAFAFQHEYPTYLHGIKLIPKSIQNWILILDNQEVRYAVNISAPSFF